MYHTENSPLVQSYDCVYLQYESSIRMKYCRQLNQTKPLHRYFNQSCHNGGQLWSFEQLARRNISTSDLLQWSSSLEQTDRYSKYLFNTSIDLPEKYLCQCINPSSFGKFCEYLFYYGHTLFQTAFLEQFKPITNFSLITDFVHIGSQLHQNRPCYLTLKCYSGLLCLDWRYICDGNYLLIRHPRKFSFFRVYFSSGHQQCMNGIDEDYCEMLEFNECEDDEYRCANGMCIPEQFWLDGQHDCMDWTDELESLYGATDFCFGRSSFICNEHLCPPDQWSCDDGEVDIFSLIQCSNLTSNLLPGQCIRDFYTNRHTGVRFGPHEFCENLRDIQYMCESVRRNSTSWWTIDGGYCLPYQLPYQKLKLDTILIEDTCDFSTRCALSDSRNEDCSCKNLIQCHNLIIQSCRYESIFYPSLGRIISPLVSMVYNRGRQWTKKKPDALIFAGQLKCLGYQFRTKGNLGGQIDENFQFYRYELIENFLCGIEEGDNVERNYRGSHYDSNCWNNSTTFNNRSFQVSFLCETRCISKYRVRDGIEDCYPDEESYHINNSCPQIQRHRFQCSSSELTCLIVGAVANGYLDCSSKRDEIDYLTGTILAGNTYCPDGDSSKCIYIRNYIQTSSNNDLQVEMFTDDLPRDNHSESVILFRSYCDSFFDLQGGFDELPELCQQWSCMHDQYQCLSGQCILLDWICDGIYSLFH